MILYDSQARSLKIALMFERLRNIGLSEDESEETAEWATFLTIVALDVFGIQAATELIEQKYFDGECVLRRTFLTNFKSKRAGLEKW